MLWALFGNDEDGPYGIHSNIPGYDAAMGGSETTWQAICWWFRNPFHNLFWHVLNWPGGPMLSISGVLYIGFRPPNGVFGMALGRGYGE